MNFCHHFTGEKPKMKKQGLREMKRRLSPLSALISHNCYVRNSSLKKKKATTPPCVKGPAPPCACRRGAYEGNRKKEEKEQRWQV